MSQEATSTVFMIVVMIALFYFMLYRPQKKQAAKRKELLSSLDYGRIKALDDKTVKLEVAPGTEITFARAAINGKVAKETATEEDED